jgi:hypothetical protein
MQQGVKLFLYSKRECTEVEDLSRTPQTQCSQFETMKIQSRLSKRISHVFLVPARHPVDYICQSVKKKTILMIAENKYWLIPDNTEKKTLV